MGDEFIKLLKQSAKRLVSDRKRYGVFLSGGHDSRLIISAFDYPVESFTVGFNKNYEADCAENIAKALNSKNTFIKLSEDHLQKRINNITRICGGQYGFLDALFTDLDEKYFKNIDYIFHGHGLDFMFQGMYLPAKYYKFFGSPIFYRKIKLEHDDIKDEFINNISFRNQDFDLKDIIKNEYVDKFQNNIQNKIKKFRLN